MMDLSTRPLEMTKKSILTRKFKALKFTIVLEVMLPLCPRPSISWANFFAMSNGSSPTHSNEDHDTL
jgi:hypothetical protein